MVDDGGTTTTYRLVPRVSGQQRRSYRRDRRSTTRAATVSTKLRWNYVQRRVRRRNEQHAIGLVQGQMIVVTSQTGQRGGARTTREPSLAATPKRDYTINPQLDDSIFELPANEHLTLIEPQTRFRDDRFIQSADYLSARLGDGQVQLALRLLYARSPGCRGCRRDEEVLELRKRLPRSCARGAGGRSTHDSTDRAGEPLVRRDLHRLVASRSPRQTDGIDDIALSTNGLLLEEQLGALQAAGLKRVNVSLDTLEPQRFERDRAAGLGLDGVLRGIDAALDMPVRRR